MADTKISALTEDASPSTDDLLVTVNDPAGTPASRKATIDNVLAVNDARTKTLTNTTIDANGTGNSISNIEAADMAATGTPSSSTFLRGDNTWATPAGGGGGDLLAANNLSDVADAATAFGNIKQTASTTATGAVEIATTAEVDTGTDNVRAISPSALNGSSPAVNTTNMTDATDKRFMTDAQETKLDSVASSATANPNAIDNVVEDTTPQLGGQLDVNGNAIGDGTNELLTFTEDASAVNHVNIENEATGSGPIISAVGDDTNIDLNLSAKGTGNIAVGNFTFDADATVGAGQDNYVMTYDNSSGTIGLEASAGGGGGGNPYNATYKIGSGGDYATLNAYLADTPTADDILFIDGDHTLTADCDLSAYNGLYIVGTRKSTITLGSYDLTLGQDSVIEGITIEKNSNGYIYNSEANVTYRNLRINTSTTSSKAIWSVGTHTRIENCRLDSATTAINNQIWLEGEGSTISNFTADIVSMASSQALVLLINGTHLTANNCNLDASTYGVSSEGIRAAGDYSLVTGCNVQNFVFPIKSADSYNTITGNTVSPNQNGAGIYVTGTYNTVTGNMVKSNYSNTKGIQCASSGDYTTITGNTVIGQATIGSGHNGIQLDSGADECVISGNLVRTWAFGININSTCDDTTVIGNIVSNIGTTAINDSGTGTLYQTATDSDPLNNIV